VTHGVTAQGIPTYYVWKSQQLALRRYIRIWVRNMPFPDDLSDILPLTPGTGVTRRLLIFGHTLFIEIKKQHDAYRLIVYDQYMHETTKRFVADRLAGEDETEQAWQEFLREGESIFRRDRATHSMP
jgi:hypothetical protein